MTDNENNKRDTLDSFLAEGMVLVQLDSRIEAVRVPEHLKGDPTPVSYTHLTLPTIA